MSAVGQRPNFSELLNRAAAACAESQRLVNRSTDMIARTRVTRGDSLRHRRAARRILQTWAEASEVHAVLREEVEQVAREMRRAGLDDRAALATVRAHIRFVLYDGGLAEQDAEPVVDRVCLWIEQVYAAA